MTSPHDDRCKLVQPDAAEHEASATVWRELLLPVFV